MSLVRLSLAIIIGLVALGLSSVAQTGDSVFQRRSDTAIIILNFDGRPQPATAVAYVVSGTLFVHGIWVEDSTTKTGPAATASAFSFRVSDDPGEHAIASGNATGPLFSALYSGLAGGKLYRIFRADESGGEGKVTITSHDAQNIKGSFSFRTLNTGNPADAKQVTGSFDVNVHELTVQ